MVNHQHIKAIGGRLFRLTSLLLASIVLSTQMAKAELTTSVDRTQISKNDIIQLTIRSDKGPIGNINLSELEAHFSIINRQHTQQQYNINGQTTVTYGLRLSLFPIDAGIFTIPAFESSGDRSQPIQITVSNKRSDPNLTHEEVILKVTPNKQQVYVQEPLLLTVELYHSVGLRDAQLSSLEVDDAIVSDAGKQTKTEKIIDGIRYSVIEKRYRITPERSGELTIPALHFVARSVDNSFYNSPSRYLRSRSSAHQISVLAKPDNYPANAAWLPTPALSLTDSWSDGVPAITVGDSITRTVTLSALNLEAAQLPDLPQPNVPTLKVYPDKTQNEDTPTGSGLVGQRIFSTAIVATQPGQFEIPPVSITWWNTKTQQLETTALPARFIQVNAAANMTTPNIQLEPDASPVATEQADSQPSGIWPYLTGLFASLWLATLFLWWRKAPRKSTTGSLPLSSQNEQSKRLAFKAFKKACQANQPNDAKTSLINWFKYRDIKLAAPGLTGIINYYQNDELKRLLGDLDTQLYSANQSPWQGQNLLQLIEKLEKNRKNTDKRRHKNDLKPLYPL